ncbi:unnamed protein product [Ixodes hexagonus]
MTIFVTIDITTDTSTLDLVFPNGIEKGGRVRLNLLRPSTGDANREAEAPRSPHDSATGTLDTASRVDATRVLERVYVSSGADSSDVDSKHPWGGESHSVGEGGSRNDSEGSDSEAVDALPDSDDASSCPSSPGSTPKRSQEQEDRPKALSGTGAIATRSLLRARLLDQVSVPVFVEEQKDSIDCPDPVAAVAGSAEALATITTVTSGPVALLHPPLVTQNGDPPQITATSTSSSRPSATIVNMASTKATVPIPPQNTHTQDGNPPRVGLIPVVHPEAMAEAEKLPAEARDAFLATSAKIVFKCLECSHSTFDKAVALQHLAEHTAAQTTVGDVSRYRKIQPSTNHQASKTPSELSSQTAPATRSAKRPQCQLHGQQPKADGSTKKCSDHSLCENRAALKERVMRETGGQGLECDQCHHFFASLSNLHAHQATVHSSSTFACDRCPLVSKSRRRLREHIIKVHRQTLPFECERCTKRFTTKRKLQQHTAIMHLGDSACLADGQNPFPSLKVYRCDQCSHVTFSLYRSKAHAITHTGVMPFPCSQCDKSFVVLDMLKRHMLMKHEKGKERPCPHCGRHFVSENFYQGHLRLHEMKGGVTCDVCGQMFESEAYLERHQHQHKAPRETCACSHCGKTYKTTRARDNHVLHMHPESASSPSVAVLRSLKYPLGCDHCPMRFKTPLEQRAHQLCRHSPGVKSRPSPFESMRYECPYCHKGYAYNCGLRAHIRKHTGERPYACNQCDRTFTKQESLKNHVVRVHTKAFKVHCPLCGKGCVNNTKLRQHLQAAHKASATPSLPAAPRGDRMSKVTRNEATRGRRRQQQQDRGQHQETASTVIVKEEVVEGGPNGEQVFVQEQEVIMAAETAMAEEDPVKLLTSFF